MRVTVSYGVKFKGGYKAVKRTVDIYNEAVKYLINVVLKEWDDIKNLDGLRKKSYINKTIHGTGPYKAKYDFDEKFYKFPSYFRKAAIACAIGHVSSYKTLGTNKYLKVNHENPTFYNYGMFKNGCLKVYRNNDWVWQPIELNHSDKRYLDKKIKEAEKYDATVSAPTVIRKKDHFELRYTISYNRDLSERPLGERIACSINLCSDTSAVCSAINSKGTVLARKFIRLSEKDHLNNLKNRLNRFVEEHGENNSDCIVKALKNCTLNMGHLTAHKVVEFAVQNDCDIIVLEHMKPKTNFWSKDSRQVAIIANKTIESLAHQNGLRVSYVCSKNTASLAYDGSGTAKKLPKNNLCQFENGKIYNRELNASYNIGARYFLREMNINLQASKQTLSTLVNLC